MESFRILTGSSWATDSQNHKSLREVHEKMKSLEQNQSSEKKLEELIPENERERTTATKQLMVSKFPEILCFQLIRNIFDMKSQRMIKLRHHISFPMEFHENDMCVGLNYRVNLSPKPYFVNQHKGLSRGERTSSSSSLSSSTGSLVIGNDSEHHQGKLYHLQAVIVHHGGSESGNWNPSSCDNVFGQGTTPLMLKLKVKDLAWTLRRMGLLDREDGLIFQMKMFVKWLRKRCWAARHIYYFIIE